MKGKSIAFGIGRFFVLAIVLALFEDAIGGWEYFYFLSPFGAGLVKAGIYLIGIVWVFRGNRLFTYRFGDKMWESKKPNDNVNKFKPALMSWIVKPAIFFFIFWVFLLFAMMFLTNGDIMKAGRGSFSGYYIAFLVYSWFLTYRGLPKMLPKIFGDKTKKSSNPLGWIITPILMMLYCYYIGNTLGYYPSNDSSDSKVTKRTPVERKVIERNVVKKKPPLVKKKPLVVKKKPPVNTYYATKLSAKEYYDRGNAKYELEDYYGAIVDYNKAIELDPDYASAYYNRGNAKSDLNDDFGACVDWIKAARMGNTNAQDNINRLCGSSSVIF